jgi:hypothetical protein
MLRHLFFIAIALLLLFQIAGQYPMFKIRQNKIHKAIKKQIAQNTPNQFLDKITFDFQDIAKIKWEKKYKEFWYQGQMYDVVRFEKTDKNIAYYCIKDTKETSLVEEFKQEITNQHNRKEQKNSGLSWDFAKKIVATDFPIVSFITENSPFILSIHKEKIVSLYSNFYQFHFLVSIDFPPEKV